VITITRLIWANIFTLHQDYIGGIWMGYFKRPSSLRRHGTGERQTESDDEFTRHRPLTPRFRLEFKVRFTRYADTAAQAVTPYETPIRN
jgi:hypothetical protein